MAYDAYDFVSGQRVRRLVMQRGLPRAEVAQVLGCTTDRLFYYFREHFPALLYERLRVHYGLPVLPTHRGSRPARALGPRPNPVESRLRELESRVTALERALERGNRVRRVANRG